jgi:rfaE bifunctional protein kinase chain/domain
MKHERFLALAAQFSSLRIVVCGDFFLDRYLWIDEARAERSVETGRVAHQVVGQSSAPGAAGTVVNNLRTLGAQVVCIGCVGNDGDGFMLRQGLSRIGADDSLLTVTADRPTPTYTKPTVRHDDGGLHELERLDIRSRVPLPSHIHHEMAAQLLSIADTVDAIIFADQMPEQDCGVVGAPIHHAIAQITKHHPNVAMFADSRQRIGDFRNVIIKPNLAEASQALGMSVDSARSADYGRQLQARTGRPVVITLGSDGVMVCATEQTHIPALPVDCPIDVVGAGDSVMAAMAVSVACGATLAEAAEIAMLVAGVTVRKLGTTGTATSAEISAIGQRYGRWE